MSSVAFDPTTRQNHLFGLAKCSQCSRCTATQEPNQPVQGVGPVNANLIVVGEAPGAAEIARGQNFTGQSGQLLWDVLKPLGIERRQVYTTNALLCGGKKEGSTKPLTKDVQACQPRLADELATVCEDIVTDGSRVILCLGATAAESVLGNKVNLNKDNGRSYWHAGLHAWVVVTYNPAALLYSPNLYPDFTWACGRAKHYLTSPNGPKAAPRNAAYIVAETATQFDSWVRQHRQPQAVCDIETTGLRVMQDDILDVVVTFGGWEAMVLSAPWTPWKVSRLQELLADRTTWIYHNGKFDVQFLREQLAIGARIDADTMLMHYLLDERAGGDDEDGGVAKSSGKGYHGLKQLAHKYLDMEDWSAGLDRAHLADVPLEQRHQYAANDVCATLDLYWALKEELAQQPPSREGFPELQVTHDKLLIPAANALADVERRGMLVDRAKLNQLRQVWTDRISVSERRLQNLAAPHLFSTRKIINLGSTAQVAKVLYDGMHYLPTQGDKTKTGRSTNKRALHDMQRQDLEAAREPNEFIEMMLDYSSLLRTKAMYLDGLEEQIDPDGRVRSDLLLHGTVSGRLASQKPNLQNIPADSPLREMFIPDDGYMMLEADYDQLEVRICAWYSRDPQLIADLQADDFHYTVAHWIFPDVVDSLEASRRSLGRLEELASRVVSFHDFARRQRSPERTDDPEVLFGWLKKRIRRQTKFCTFGIIYGRGAKALADPETGLGVSVEEAALYKDRWTQRYRFAMAWLAEQSRNADRYQWVESATGRRRRFPWQPAFLRGHIDNQASNMPIQSWASDVCMKSLIQLETALPSEGLGNVLMTVHDSIICQVPIPYAEQARGYVQRVMENQLLDDEIAFTAEVHLGPNWGACRK